MRAAAERLAIDAEDALETVAREDLVHRGSDGEIAVCPILNFFVSPANAERWLAEHPEVRGSPISMGEAAAAGRAVFGNLLTPA